MLLDLLLASAAAVSVQAAAAPPVAPAVQEKKVCRKVDPIVGTRIGGTRRVCRTQRQWDNLEQESQQLRRDIDERAGAQICLPGDGGCAGATPNPQ